MNKLNVVSLNKANQDTVSILKRLLKRAESGEVQGIAYCADCAGGNVDTGYTPLVDRILIVGMIERMKCQIMTDMIIESAPINTGQE